MTDGALAAHDHGIVTACSVVAGGIDLWRAAEQLKTRPALEAGVHLVLAGGPLVSALADIPTLAPRGRPMGGYLAFVARLALGRIDMSEVERELREQIERVREAGLRPTHLNGHQHLHVAPGVIEIVSRLARDYDIGYVRIPDERVLPLGPRAASIWLLGRLARRARDLLRRAGIATNERAVGLVHAGHLTKSRLRDALARVDGITELVAHPGVGADAIRREFDWGYDWDAEREALTDGRLRERLDGLGISLTGPSAIA